MSIPKSKSHPKPKAKLKFIIPAVALLLAYIGMPNLRLVGLHKDKTNNSIAIIEDQDTKKQDVFSEAMSTFGKAMLTKISSDSVTIQSEGESYTLRPSKGAAVISSFSKETDNYVTAITLTNTSADAIVTRITEQDKNLPLIHFSQIYLDQNSSLSLKDAITLSNPVMQNTEDNLSGVRLTSIDKTNPLAKLGLRSGDTLISLNGRSIDSTQSLYEISMIDPGERTPEISLVRDGQTIALQFQMD